MKLSRDSAKLKKRILSLWILTESQLEVLDAALSARDLWRAAEETVERDGLTVAGDRGGLKAHPLLPVIRDARAQFLTGLKLLKLHLDDDDEPVRGPGAPTAYEKMTKMMGKKGEK